MNVIANQSIDHTTFEFSVIHSLFHATTSQVLPLLYTINTIVSPLPSYVRLVDLYCYKETTRQRLIKKMYLSPLYRCIIFSMPLIASLCILITMTIINDTIVITNSFCIFPYSQVTRRHKQYSSIKFTRKENPNSRSRNDPERGCCEAAVSENSGVEKTSTTEPDSPPSSYLPSDNIIHGTGKKIYSMPSLYDMAFGYRNFEEEVDFLLHQHTLLDEDGRAPQRIIELAAGPARHSIQALKAHPSVDSVTALDSSAEMIEYAKVIATEELQYYDGSNANAQNQRKVNNCFHYIQGDMSNFTIIPEETEPTAPPSQLFFDSAWILLGSLQHLTTNEQVISCFNCIHRALRPGGTFILELPHPREIFSLVECTRNGWDVPLEDENGNTSGELKIVWGDNDDDFDPITQVRQFTISMKLTGDHMPEISDDTSDNNTISEISEVVPMRHFTSQEIDAFARIAGFEVMSMHGAVAHDVSVDDDDEAFRLVCVLQKKK